VTSAVSPPPIGNVVVELPFQPFDLIRISLSPNLTGRCVTTYPVPNSVAFAINPFNSSPPCSCDKAMYRSFADFWNSDAGAVYLGFLAGLAEEEGLVSDLVVEEEGFSAFGIVIDYGFEEKKVIGEVKGIYIYRGG
jgi:hypothetical protein